MKSAAAFVLAFAAIFLLHLPLLPLPYFWDEAGYYVPAARDLLLSGDLIPHSTPSNAHPPLVMAYLAGAWKLAGFSPLVTRTAMLMLGAFALLGVFRLARRVANEEVAIAATVCTALYPVFFAQSSLAQVDLAAAGLTLWGLDAYLARRWRATALWFSMAVLAKETAVLTPVALLAWEIVFPWLKKFQPLKGLAVESDTAPLKRRPDTNLPITAAEVISAADEPASSAVGFASRPAGPVPRAAGPVSRAVGFVSGPAGLVSRAAGFARRAVDDPNPERLQALSSQTYNLSSNSSSAWAGLFAPILVLTLWYAYHYARTGYIFGNPEFFRYNVQATVDPLRILLVLGMRLWQAFGYLHLWVLTLLMFWAMTRPPLRDADAERPRIAIPTQAVFGLLVLTYTVALAIVGGAVLARYLLTIIPLVIIVAVSTLWRRLRAWYVLIAIVCLAFILALFLNPPYGFAPEDNLAYRDYVVMHQKAEAYLQAHYAQARVLTAWPASDELTRPYLGYVLRPMQVLRMEDFSLDQMMAATQSVEQSSAQENHRYDVALVFSTKYEPAHPFLGNNRTWQGLKSRFFGFHRDLPPEVAAQILGGHIVFAERRPGQWVAVIEMDRAYEAKTAAPNRNVNSSLH